MSARLAAAALQADLGPWISSQRWFAGKAREIAQVQVRDSARLGGRLLDVFVRVTYSDGGQEDYQLPLLDEGDSLSDALHDPDACRLLAELALSASRHPTEGDGELIGRPLRASRLPDGQVRAPGAEQSNSSVVFGDEAILKVFRKLEPGTNPDVELTRALTEAGFPHAPAQRGCIDLATPGHPPTTLAVLTDFVAGADEGWVLATRRPDQLLEHLEDLGRAVAGAHRVLAERFPTRAAAPTDVEGWGAAMHRQLDAVLATAAARDPDGTGPLLAAADEIRLRLRAGLEAPAPGQLQRIHGDLHLGQVLWHPVRGWQLLDFEGEPARPLAERREPHSPLRDVAGMLRSFDYAAGHMAGSMRWLDLARDRFLAGYRPAAEAAALLPGDNMSEWALLAAFELDKAVYELGYELANRPAWVGIPVRGILRLLGG